MDDFLLRATIAGLAIAVAAGPLGCVVVWRRMAYFGDTMAHSALLGVGLGVLAGTDASVGVVAVCVALAVLLGLNRGAGRLASDTVLGLMAHSALAGGLVLASLSAEIRLNLNAYLFGDILAVDSAEIAWVIGGSALTVAGMIAIWRPLLAMSVHEELARVEGMAVERARFAFVLLMALTVAMAMKIVGVVLVTALLIIPAAAARGLARSPESMAAWAIAIGGLAVVGGVTASATWDTPSGPSIVLAATLLFVLSRVPGLAALRPR